MAVSLLSALDTCTMTAGTGMVNTWTITGMTSTYGGLLETDGY